MITRFSCLRGLLRRLLPVSLPRECLYRDLHSVDMNLYQIDFGGYSFFDEKWARFVQIWANFLRASQLFACQFAAALKLDLVNSRSGST